MAPKAPLPVTASRSSGTRPWEGQRVLIVDDSPGVREQLKNAYTAIGMEVVGLAVNGLDGLKQFETANPDLVSLDIIMPEMDGVECYKKIHASGRAVKCVMISWIGGEPNIIENLSKIIPAHLFQAKPATAATLVSRLEKVYGLVPVENPAEKVKEKSEDDLDLAFSSLKVKVS